MIPIPPIRYHPVGRLSPKACRHSFNGLLFHTFQAARLGRKTTWHSVGMDIESLLENPLITDIVLNGSACFVLQAGVWVRQGDLSEGEVASLAIQLCERGGRRLDLASPFADVTVGGHRVHAVLPAGVSNKPLLSIRKHSNKTVPLSGELQKVVQNKQNFLISGGTGSGKTTLLRSMLGNLPERVITIEDVGELGFDSPNYVSLVSRPPNIEGAGEIGLERLFREALRMRPDRIILGEVRGAEFGLLLQALNTGHAGSGATIHANSLRALPSRLIGLGMIAGLTAESAIALAKTAIETVIHITPQGLQIARLGDLFD